MAKNCTCSQLQETIDKIFIDDSCCCQSTVVTPTDNSCSCEPVIDLIDTDKFACVSFDPNRNLKYQMIRESWLMYGTNSKTVYNAIIESQASEIMLLLKVIGGGVNENTKNYVISPIEVSQDVESGLYIIKYLKFIEGKLNICTYTIHKINDNEYDTNWEYDEMDDFDASQYYNKTEIDNKFATTNQYITNNYYTSEIINTNFYTKNQTYNKNEIDNFFNTKVLWEKGQGQTSTQRKNAYCEAKGNYSLAAGIQNTANGEGTVALGVQNTANGKYSFVAGYNNNINGDSNIAAGNSNTVILNNNLTTSDNNITAGSNNTLTNASNSGTVGYGNNVSGSCNFAGGKLNTIKDTSNSSFSFGQTNEITGKCSTVFGNLNTIEGNSSFAAGSENIIIGDYSSTIGINNAVNGSSSVALGIDNSITQDNSFALGFNNHVKHHYNVALNEANRAEGMSSIAAGRRSYTSMTGSFAMGSPVNIKYFAKLVDPNAQEGDTYYGYLVLTDSNGDPVNIAEDSIQNKRFTFSIAEGVYWGELTIQLTNTELQDSRFKNNLPAGAVWPSIQDIKIIESTTNRYIYFLPAGYVENIIWLFNNTDNGIRSISYASGYDGCKATNIGSHAEGYGTIAKGTGSHSEGVNTFTQNTAEHACGKYNYSTDNTLFSIGIGNEEYTNPNDGSNVTITRKNALEVTQNGKIYLRISNDNTENVYDLGKLLIALINATSIDLNGIATDETSRQLVQYNNEPLSASTKAL